MIRGENASSTPGETLTLDRGVRNLDVDQRGREVDTLTHQASRGQCAASCRMWTGSGGTGRAAGADRLVPPGSGLRQASREVSL